MLRFSPLRSVLLSLAGMGTFGAPTLMADQSPITIDGEFSDWSSVPVLFTDSSGDDGNSGIDLGALRVADDDRFLFIQIEIGTLAQLDEGNDLVLYIDTDLNSGTGISVGGIGAELEWRFGQRNGDFDPPGSGSSFIFHDDIRLRSGPTVSSTVHEIAIGRDTLPDGSNSLFSASTVRMVLRDEGSGGDRLPNGSGGVNYTMDVGGPVSTSAIPIDRIDPQDLRLLTYNVQNDSPWDGGQESRFGRQLAAIEADIVCFQEIYNHSASQAATLVGNWVSSGSGWNAEQENDCITVSRFPILDSWPLDGNLACLIDTTARIGTTSLVINAHLPCCTNDNGRQEEVDRILEFMRDALTPGGLLDFPLDAPMLVAGDLNLVGLSETLVSLLTGNIDDNSGFGPDFAPDWDGTGLQNVLPRQTEKRMGYTWRNDNSSFWPGHLDYWILTDSVIDVVSSYALYTPEMSSGALATHGLFASDTEAADHLPFVIDLRPGFAFFSEACNGDGGDQLGCTDCPCSNDAPQGTLGGCLNSAGTSMRLLASGSASVSAADLRFEGAGAPPNNSAVLSSGNAIAPANMTNPCFGLNSGVTAVQFDGLRCAVQGVLRHGVRPSDVNGEIGVTTNGWGTPNGFFGFNAFTAGSTKHFQVIYRDDDTAVCMTGQNTSQAVTVMLAP